MSGFNYDMMFPRTDDDEDNLKTIAESLTRQMSDDDDDDKSGPATTCKLRPDAAGPVSVGTSEEARVECLKVPVEAEATAQVEDSRTLLAFQDSGRSAVDFSRTLDQADSRSLLSAYSRFSQALSSSEPPTPGVMSAAEPPVAAARVMVPTNPTAAYDHAVAGTGHRCLMSYNPQEDCPPPYEWCGERAKHTQLPASLQTPLASPHAARTTAGVQSFVQVPGGVYPAAAQMTQARPAMAPPPPNPAAVGGTYAPGVGLGQMVHSHALPASSMAPATSGAALRLQAAPSVTGGAPAPPPGYVQFLTPVHNVGGSAGCQMVMVPTQHIGQEHREFSQQHQQHQHVMQYVWKAPPQQFQPQQLAQSQQFVAQQLHSAPRPSQGYAIVQPGGQQSCMMAISTNQLQHIQPQTFIHQQLQPNSARQVFVASQNPQQQLFAASLMPTSLPMGCRFN